MESEQPGELIPEKRRRGASVTRTPWVYEWSDYLTGGLILAMTVATPWLFGTTPDWAIWTMNWFGYSLGLLLLGKYVTRLATGYKPVRWTDENAGGGWITILMLLLTIAILGFCLVSAVNARATFHYQEQRFEYHEGFNKYLPFSYDSNATWDSFWMYLGLACFFWALRDWLLTKSKGERRRAKRSQDFSSDTDAPPLEDGHSIPLLPDRLRMLLWVLCLNGALVAFQGMLQRLSRSPNLLWLLPAWYPEPEANYGPFSYRSNAAQFMNLIWPVCLGFWWTLHGARRSQGGKPIRIGEGSHLLLIPSLIMLMAGPFLSSSRGAAFVAALGIVMALGVLFANKRTTTTTRLGMLAILFIVGVIAYNYGWYYLRPRLNEIEKNILGSRGEIYDNTRNIAADFPRFGTGPGTFAAVYHLYRIDSDQVWHSHVHDDWLETRVTFGWVGLSIILVLLFLALVRWFAPGGISLPFPFVSMIWIALGGSLLHARFDFPFQVYSVLYVFLLLCGVLFCSSRARFT